MRRCLLFVFAVAACTRDPAAELCPPIEPGELVVTEVRGPQTDDSGPQWIELYNAAATTTDLEGLKIRFRRPDGSDEVPVLVRRKVQVPAGSYVVLGLAADGSLPDFVDYGFATDFQSSWLASAVVDVESCGELIDRARYDSLPRAGTFSLGAMPPTAEANDLPASWCTDGTTVGTSHPGTPQAANIECPPP